MSAEVENPVQIETITSALELQRIEESEMEDVVPNITSHHASLKHTDTQDSISSNDSDISLSYDTSNVMVIKPVQMDEANMADMSDSGSDNCESGDKDSGCEVTPETKQEKQEAITKEEEETPFIPPDEELANRIVAQVEFYFSDVNITKDAFLLKHVKRNKEGYVSLKLISSFKRVKHLAKDWRVVAYALQRSTKLQINELGTKLRRVDPLPPYDQTAPSRTIVAINLPMEKPTIESVAELFRGCGEIALIRILRPGNPIPADVRSFFNKHPEMSGTVSALVEFDRTEYAKLAIERQDSDWRTNAKGMKVVELNAPPSTDRKRRAQNKKTVASKLADFEFSSSCHSSSEAEHERRFRQRRSSSPHQRPQEIPWLQRRLSINRDSGSDSGCREQYRPPCSCCCERRYSSSGSGYDSPVPSSYRHFSAPRDNPEPGFGVPYSRRFSGTESPCCLPSRRFSRDSGSESSSSFGRIHELPRRYSRDSMSGSEMGMHRRYSRDSISSETGTGFRRISRDSIGSENTFAPPFLSRSNSRDVIEVSRRMSSGSIGGCEHQPLARSASRQSFSSAVPCTASYPPHMPENVVRMPKGPDGSKGFGHAQ